MEQEQFDSDFRDIYNVYIRKEKEESDKIYREIAPDLSLPERRIRRWWYPAAAAILILIAGTWMLTSDQNPFKPKPKYTQAEIRQSLEKTIRALSIYSKTVRKEFSRIEDLAAITEAIRPAKKGMSGNRQKSESNTSKN
jgi:hypothetical protein